MPKVQAKKKLTAKQALKLHKEFEDLEKRQEEILGLIHDEDNGCPHPKKVHHKERYDEPDCDGMFGGTWAAWDECKICGEELKKYFRKGVHYSDNDFEYWKVNETDDFDY